MSHIQCETTDYWCVYCDEDRQQDFTTETVYIIEVPRDGCVRQSDIDNADTEEKDYCDICETSEFESRDALFPCPSCCTEHGTWDEAASCCRGSRLCAAGEQDGECDCKMIEIDATRVLYGSLVRIIESDDHGNLGEEYVCYLCVHCHAVFTSPLLESEKEHGSVCTGDRLQYLYPPEREEIKVILGISDDEEETTPPPVQREERARIIPASQCVRCGSICPICIRGDKCIIHNCNL